MGVQRVSTGVRGLPGGGRMASLPIRAAAGVGDGCVVVGIVYGGDDRGQSAPGACAVDPDRDSVFTRRGRSCNLPRFKPICRQVDSGGGKRTRKWMDLCGRWSGGWVE